MILIQITGLMWMVVWSHLYFGGPRHSMLPIHPGLRTWSVVTFMSILLFYTTIYMPINSFFLDAFLAEHQMLDALAFTITALGFILIIISRQALRHLSGIEVFVCLSDFKSKHWVYKYMKHPMYYGISLVLLGSWLLESNLTSLLFAVLAIVAMANKSYIESNHFKVNS